MNFRDPEVLKKFGKFLDSVKSDSEYLSILETLVHSGVGLPVIVCASPEEIAKPDPSRENKEKSFDDAVVDFLFISRFFPVDGKQPVILDSNRNLVYPK